MADYTDYDYQEQLERMRTILSNKEGWGDAFESSMGDTLTRMMVDVTDYLHYMLERRTIENYLLTAKTQTAVFARASERGYRANRIIANNGDLELVIVDGNGNPTTAMSPITIDQFTEFTFDGRTFTSAEEVVLDVGESSVLVPVRDGVKETLTFSQSEYDEEYFILIEDYQDIDNDTLRVTANGIEFNDVTKTVDGFPARRAMSFVESDEYFYDIRYEVDGMRIILGDGQFGAAPTGDLTIDLIRVQDIDNPVNNVGNTFESSFVATSLNGTTYEYQVTNIEKIRRGQPIEDIETVKEKASVYTKTNGRAVTPEDINYWTREANIGGMIDSFAMGEQELGTVVKNRNNVYINYLLDDADELTTAEQQELRDYLSGLLVTTIHPIFRKVDNLNVQTRLEARKNPNLEMSNSEFYSRLKKFFDDYFELKRGSIGKGVQHSEVVRDLHRLSVNRNGVDYELVDYVKLDLDAVYPITVPPKIKSANVDINNDYVPTDGDQFILLLQNVVCDATVASTDGKVDILNKMRDKINDVTPFIARVEFGDIAVDGFGNPLPIEIDANIGSGLLIGTDTPYREPTEVLTPPAIGSTLARFVLNAASVDVQHFYYSQKAGRRPLIPLRQGTTVSFTAPSDTNVVAYTRTTMSDPSTETTLTTVTAGQAFSEVFNSGEHSLQFEFVNDSDEDVTVDIAYPNIADINLGLRIETRDNFGTFTLQTTSGDLSNDVTVAYNLGLPPVKRVVDTENNQILPSSLEVLNAMGEVVYKSTIDGRFTDPSGNIIATGRVDYLTSNITLPQDMTNGDYYVRYRQNKFQNLKTDESSTLVLMPISEDKDSSNMFSKITINQGVM